MILKKLAVTLSLALASMSLTAQTDTAQKATRDKLNDFSIGANFHEYGLNIGTGLDVTSPYWDISDNHDWKQSVAVRLKYDMCNFNGTLQGESTVSAFFYSIISIGFVERQVIIPQKLSFVMELNGNLILPESQMSSEMTRWGLSFLPAIELYITPRKSVFFGMGLGATPESCIADKLVGKPNYYYTNENGRGGGGCILLAFGVQLYL